MPCYCDFPAELESHAFILTHWAFGGLPYRLSSFDPLDYCAVSEIQENS